MDAPFVVLQFPTVPQLNESRFYISLVHYVRVVHPLMTGQSNVLGGWSTVGGRTPLCGPEGSTSKQKHVPAIAVRRNRLKPAGNINVNKSAFVLNQPEPNSSVVSPAESELRCFLLRQSFSGHFECS